MDEKWRRPSGPPLRKIWSLQRRSEVLFVKEGIAFFDKLSRSRGKAPASVILFGCVLYLFNVFGTAENVIVAKGIDNGADGHT